MACVLYETCRPLPDTSFSHPRVSTSQSKEEREVASFAKIYAVFSDDVMVHLCALLRRTRLATVLKSTS